MRPNIFYKNFSYSDILTKFISEQLDYKILKTQKFDQELVEIFFFRPHSTLRQNEIIFECHLEAALPWLPQRLSATCQDRRFWQALRRALSLLIKQINTEIQKYKAAKKENDQKDYKWILEHWEYGQYEH
jgi:hypothetical protein